MDIVVVLTALFEERQAVRSLLADPHIWVHPTGTRYDVAHLATPGWHVAVGSTGRGNRSAAALTERSISTFRPAAVLLAGTAGSLRPDIGLGDVVVGTEIYAIHGGRDDADRFRLRPRSWEASHRLLQLAEHLATSGHWARSLGYFHTARVHFGAIAAGEVVLNSPQSTLANHLRDWYNDAAAIDTEDAGAAQAGHLHDATPLLAIRGISDIATVDKTTTDAQGWRTVAAAHAAAFAVALVHQFAADSDRLRPCART